MLLPLVVIAVIVVAFVLHRLWKRRAGSAPEATLFEQSLPLSLLVLFFAYPKVTQIAFEAFSCHEFEDGARGWLKADVAIECGTAEHATAAGVATTAILLYPVGLNVFFSLLLLKARKAIVGGIETPLSRATAFLHKEYEPTCFWWELAEMLRRFLLVGLFIIIEQGKMMQLALGTIVCGVFLLIQMQAKPYRNPSDDMLASASSFSLLMVFVCSIFYKYAALTDAEELQAKMSLEQREDYIMSSLTLSVILTLSVAGSIIAAGVISIAQVVSEARRQAKLRRIKFVKTKKPVILEPLVDAQAFHLFLSHGWPAAQDRMRIVKARFLEALPSWRSFLDVDDLKSGSGTAEVDKSECILVFTTTSYFTKKNSMKELYRAVVQRRPILAMLEPDMTQEGGLTQAAITEMLTSEQLDGVEFKWLKKQYSKWADEVLGAQRLDHAPSGAEARLRFRRRARRGLPHFQDVTSASLPSVASCTTR